MQETTANILRLLSIHPDTTKEQLSKRLEVSERTIRRHLEKLCEKGDVLVARVGHRKVYRLSPGSHPLPDVPRLTEAEAEALTIASLSGLSSLTPTPFAGKVRSALDKLESNWLTEVFSFEPELENKVWSFDPVAGPADDFMPDVFVSLLNGIRRQHPVVTEYYSAYRRATSVDRKLHPLGFLVRRGSWLLVAFCCESRMVKDFAVGGFRRVVLVDGETFDRPRDFDIHEHASGRFGALASEKTYDLLLRVSKEAAPYFERKKYHPSQQIQSQNADGTLTVSFRVEGLTDISVWVLSWGAKVKVLEPEELVEHVVKLHSGAAAQYHLGTERK